MERPDGLDGLVGFGVAKAAGGSRRWALGVSLPVVRIRSARRLAAFPRPPGVPGLARGQGEAVGPGRPAAVAAGSTPPELAAGAAGLRPGFAWRPGCASRPSRPAR